MSKIRYCNGCGVRLQDENMLNIGFTTNLKNDLCMRCFRLKNYGEYESVASSLIDVEKILKSINKTNSLVLYAVDLLNLPKNIKDIKKIIHNDCILVLNKRDLLPLSVKDEKIIDYIKKQDLGFNDIVITSSEKNYGMDLLHSKIKKYQNGVNVYVVGYTNAGKSSLISRFIKDYGNGNVSLSTSPLPSTTLDKIIIPINKELTLIDTPGIIDNNNIINFVDKKLYKKLNTKREIKPKTYQLNGKESLLVDELLRINYLDNTKNSFTFYIPNDIKIQKAGMDNMSLKELDFRTFLVNDNEDLVISGLGFVKIVSKCRIEIHINKDIEVFTRKSMI